MKSRAPGDQPLALSPCPECGFDYDEVQSVGDVLSRIAAGVSDLAALVSGDNGHGTERNADLRQRPQPGVWSALEYACHVRDVLIAERERVILALIEEHPHFTPLYRDERVTLARYNQEEPLGEVAAGLRTACHLLAWLYQQLNEAQLGRACTYDLPNPTDVSVRWVLVHTAHEVTHHLGDVERVLERVERDSVAEAVIRPAEGR